VTSVELPVGTVTFLFTDIEGSTKLLRQLGGERYGEALADHQRILRELFEERGGHEIDTQGDSFFVAFRRAKDAVSTAVEAQRRLGAHRWPDGSELRVRMGIHTGEPAAAGERYVGMGVHRAARICAAGHGGQVLLSQTTRELLRDDPIQDVTLRDLGEHQLKDMDEPERIYQLVAPGLGEDFPGLTTAASTPFEGREGELAEAAAEEMARSWRRPGRRVLLGATFAAAVVGAMLGVLLTQGGDSIANASVSANAVGVLDEESGKIRSEVTMGGAPADIAAGTDAIWVTNLNDKSVARIEPATNQVVQTIPVGGGPNGVAFGAGAVWVANGLDGTVSRIDPSVNREVQRLVVGNGPSGIAYGAGYVWVTNSADGTVSRIDPESTRSQPKAFPAIIGASGVAVGFDRVWVASPPSATVVALDPRSGSIVSQIGVGGEPSAVTVGTDAVWVANRADGTVSKIDPETSRVTDVVPVGGAPEALAVSQDGVWVADEAEGTLIRLDPTSGAIADTVKLDNPPRGIALSPQGVYVAVGSTGIEHRGGELRVLTSGDPGSLDPVSGNPGVWSILLATNNGLVGFRKVGGAEGAQLVPDLAVALPTPTDGGRAYTFEVREGIRYSNGQLVQPVDFRRAIERLWSAGEPKGFAAYYAGIVGSEGCGFGKKCDLSRGIVVDRAARTVTFRLVEPDADFLARLALPMAFAVPRGTPTRTTGTRPVPATGPYEIAGYDQKRRRVLLNRNPVFREWSVDAQPEGYPDSISVSWRLGEETPARLRAIERGTADVAVDYGLPIPKDVLDSFAVRHPGLVRLNTSLSTSYFFLNTRVAPFDNAQARRAVNIAFDREALARQLGRQFAPTCQILPPNLPGYRPKCSQRSSGVESLEVARRLVKRSGTAGQSVTVWVPTEIADRGRFMVSLLGSLGYRARLQTNGIDDHFVGIFDSRVEAQTGYTGWIALYPSAADFLPPQFSCASFVPAAPDLNANPSQFCDPQVDAQMKRAALTQAQDPPAGTLLWQQAEGSLLAHAPVVPIYNRNTVDFVSERVGNYQYNPQWGVLLSQLWVK
jgi:peptide/nickel transport system substrate-binding protein